VFATLARSRYRLLALLLALAGIALILVDAAPLALGAWRQHQLVQQWHGSRSLPEQAFTVTAPVQSPAPVVHHPGADGVDFAIKVPRLGYTAIVREGVDLGTLESGPGHYTTTAWPGDPGNVGVAAHNTYWLAFGSLSDGDEVDLDTTYGLYKYRISDVRIVGPADNASLRQDSGHQLTLTTCWPLYMGALADKRLILIGDQVDPAPTFGPEPASPLHGPD
jgi:LPXTG-site transpeptidase (sortase) family protein